VATVRDLRLELEALLRTRDGESRLIRTLLTELARHDDVMLSDFLRRMSYDGTKARPRPARKAFDETAMLQRLQANFEDDTKFRALLGELDSDKNASRETLNALYNSLFGRNRRLPSKATRSGLIRDIGDERNALVRSRKAAAYLSGER
jgi:hypothetical protein